jgi:8-oxo-dGTP pyrophosphatase MutT (NUDIX family)
VGAREPAEWHNLGEQPVISTPWFRLNRAEVELPGGRQLDHYVLRVPPVVLAAVLDGRDRVLLLWRHRFIPGSWGWELPGGICDPEEDLAAAAARETLKESGWEPAELRPLLRLESYSGLTDSASHIFWTGRADHRGEPAASFEADRIEWIPLDEVPTLISGGRIPAATSATALLWLYQLRQS